MNFFDELLNSYNLLKKRKLRINLPEESRSNPYTYGELSKQNNDAARQAVENTNTIIKQAFPEWDGKSKEQQCQAQDPTQGAKQSPVPAELIDNKIMWGRYTLAIKQEQPQQGGETQVASQGSCIWKIYPADIIVWRNAIAQAVYTEGVDSQAAESGVQGDAAEFLYSQVGRGLVDELGEIGETAIPELTKLKQKLYPESGIDSKKSYFSVALNTLKNNAKIAANMEKLRVGSVEAVSVTNEDVVQSMSTLNTALDYIQKVNDNQPTVTIDEKEFIRDNLTLLKKPNGNYSVLINIGDGSVGISFDGGDQSQLYDVVKNYNELQNVSEENYSVETIDRQVILDRSEKAIRSNKAITDVSESIDTLIVLGESGRTKEAAMLYSQLSKQYKDNVYKCLGITKAVEEGEYVADEDTEFVGGILDSLKEINGEEDQSSTEAFKKLVQRFVSRRRKELKEINPDYVVRTGGRAGAGREGFKTDQMYLFKEKRSDNVKVSANVFTEAEKQSLKENFGQEALDALNNGELYVQYDSLKFTKAEDRVSLGSMPSAEKIANEFTKSKRFQKQMMKFIGADEEKIREVFQELSKGFETYAMLQAGETPNLSNDEINSILNKTFGSLGSKPLESKDLLVKFFESKIKNEDIEKEKVYRQVAALYVLRGAYDSNNAFDTLALLTSNKTIRHRRNKDIENSLSSFLDEGKGFSLLKNGFKINNLSTSFEKGGKRAGRGGVVRSISAQEREDSETSAEEMYKFFQKLYEALTSVE